MGGCQAGTNAQTDRRTQRTADGRADRQKERQTEAQQRRTNRRREGAGLSVVSPHTPLWTYSSLKDPILQKELRTIKNPAFSLSAFHRGFISSARLLLGGGKGFFCLCFPWHRFRSKQCDQMSLCEKNRPKCGPTQFFVKINRYIAFAGEKSNPDIWVSFVIFAKLPIVNRLLGENSPNLVTLTSK
jgi:hypothetical protein